MGGLNNQNGDRGHIILDLYEGIPKIVFVVKSPYMNGFVVWGLGV